MRAVQNVKATVLKDFIRENAEPRAVVQTDRFKSYGWLDASEFAHQTVDHRFEYVNWETGATANGVENVWSLFKELPTQRRMGLPQLFWFVGGIAAECNGSPSAFDVQMLQRPLGRRRTST